MQLVETVAINANYLTVYNTIIDGTSKTCESSNINFADTFHDCRMSESAKKQIKKSINLILYLAKRQHYKEAFESKNAKKIKGMLHASKVHDYALEESNNKHLCTFITLTLPAKQQHSDVELTQFCLNPFLTYCRKYFKIKYYIWKKELQANGNLHFHLVTDRFIPHKYLRACWNRIINRGKIEGVQNPFSYVDDYHNNMLSYYRNGFDDKKVFEDLKNSEFIQDKTSTEVAELEEKEQRSLTTPEFLQILYKHTQRAFDNAKRNYLNEIKKPASERYFNPNSTDIKPVRTAKGVAYYTAKYIAKDIENDAIIAYQNKVQAFKDIIVGTMKLIEEKRSNGENTETEEETLEAHKKLLHEVRLRECPILGKMWFKSASLTPFLQGAREFVHINKPILEELRFLDNYLSKREKEKNKTFILRRYDLNEDGTENKDKVLSTTFLIDIFEMQSKRYVNSNRLMFPELVKVWQRFVGECLDYNRRHKIYDCKEEDIEEIDSVIK